MSLPYNKKLIKTAKTLRKNMTPQEHLLWYNFLSHYPVRFQRQKTIGNYIIDFYCHRAKLAIEIDGTQHYTEEALSYDNARTNKLSEHGIRVIRILNINVDKNFEGVCALIDNEVQNRL